MSTTTTRRRAFFTPNAKSLHDLQWRLELNQRAVGILAMAPMQQMSGPQLAQCLGVSPRGLRPAIKDNPLIQPVLVEDDHERWYRLVILALPAPTLKEVFAEKPVRK
jgi:hypothetical protein